jgi:hypothetical protein
MPPSIAFLSLGRGVLAYDLGQDGAVVYSNGNAIYSLSPQGERARLCKADGSSEVVLVA